MHSIDRKARRPRRGGPSWLHLLPLLAVLALVIGTTGAEARKVLEKTEVRDYRVYGRTPGQMVAYMKRRPFRGDNGPAMANIRPKYSLNTRTVKKGKTCRIKRVDLNIRFVMTLPRSMDAAKQSRNTRHAWRSFRAFAKRHEEQHRRIYMRCARDFVRNATKLPARKSCGRLDRDVKKLLKEQEKECDKKHLAFDRREFPRVPSLPLFRQARQEKLKGTKTANNSRQKRRRGWFTQSN